MVLSGTCTVAHLVSDAERRAWTALGGVQGRRSERDSRRFEVGEVREVRVVWPVIAFVLGITALATTFNWWLGETSGWWYDGWGLLGFVERVRHVVHAWFVARRVTGPFGLELADRGLPLEYILAGLGWTFAVIVSVAIVMPDDLRDLSRIFGRSGRVIRKAGK